MKHYTLILLFIFISTRLITDQFQNKDGYKLELQISETLKLFGSTKKLIKKNKDEEHVPRLEVVKVVLVQYHLVDNQYHQKSEVLYKNGRLAEIQEKVHLTLLTNKQK